MYKKCLIVVDYQNDFVSGSLGFPEAKEIEEVIVEKINKYHENDTIIFTLDTHQENYLDTQEGKHLPVPHCLENTSGHELYGKIKALKEKNDLTFVKNTFPSLDLANYLKEEQFDEIELCGLVSHICVFTNAIMAKSALPNARIFIDINATASYSEELEEKAFALLEALHVEII